MAKKKSLVPLKIKHTILRDKIFWAALVAALPFWGLLYWLHAPQDPLAHLISNIGRFVLAAAVSPAIEEVLFRGALQEYLAKQIDFRIRGPVSPANLVTSMLFAILHGIIWANLWALLVFFPSLVYGYFKDKTGALGAPIALHAFYNAGFFLVTAR